MNLEVGKKYEVTVVNIVPVGAVVELEDHSTELVHISNIADCYVSDVANFVQVGVKYTATCEEGKSKPIQLSFIPLGLKPIVSKPSRRHAANLDAMLENASNSYNEKKRLKEKSDYRKRRS